MQSLKLERSHGSRDPTTATHVPTFDVLVVSATDLIDSQTRTNLLQRIHTLMQRVEQGGTPLHSAWLLLMTHTHQERMIASTLTGALAASAPWCRGVRVVEERTAEETAKAAIELHRLHYPTIPDRERLVRILVVGSTKERALTSPSPPSRRTPIHNHRIS